MLKLEFSDNFLTYKPGFCVGEGPTRYEGEYWGRIASDLLCGVADVFQDVGLVHVGNPLDADIESVRSAGRRWVEINDQTRRGKSVWAVSSKHGWLFVPSCREAVEDVMAWTTPYFREGVSTKGALSLAFSGLRRFRDQLDTNVWEKYDENLHDLVRRTCTQRPLFTMRWGPGAWVLYPGEVKIRHLLKLADPVACRINAVNSEE